MYKSVYFEGLDIVYIYIYIQTVFRNSSPEIIVDSYSACANKITSLFIIVYNYTSGGHYDISF